MGITARDRFTYDERGFVVLEGGLDPVCLERLRDGLDRWTEQAGPPGPYGMLKHNVWREQGDVARLVGDGSLARVACRLLDLPQVVLFQDNLVWKPPGARRIEWHQDFSYWPLDAATGVTLWVALDDADVANGCLHYVPGTHRLGERQPADFIAGTGQPMRPDLPPLDLSGREREAVPAEVAAGRILAHHPLVWHMSPPNHSNRPRRALTFTWITPDVRWDPEHAPHPYDYALRPTRGDPVRGDLFPCFDVSVGQARAGRDDAGLGLPLAG
jgi:hypothetical protein